MPDAGGCAVLSAEGIGCKRGASACAFHRHMECIPDERALRSSYIPCAHEVSTVIVEVEYRQPATSLLNTSRSHESSKFSDIKVLFFLTSKCGVTVDYKSMYEPLNGRRSQIYK